jgi:hypothetical protein
MKKIETDSINYLIWYVCKNKIMIYILHVTKDQVHTQPKPISQMWFNKKCVNLVSISLNALSSENEG